MSQNAPSHLDQDVAVWPQVAEETGRAYSWRLFRVRDEKRHQTHVLAVGIHEVGCLGDERIDLVARLIDVHHTATWKAHETVCVMSARRTHGLKLTNGFVVVERESLRSLNIGSLCFNEIVKWARRVAPNDVVLPIRLLESHVNTYVKENLERRHRFYCQFGLSFEFKSDASHPLASGESKPVAGCDLISHPLTKYANIDEIDIVTTVQRFAVDHEELRIDVKRLKKALSDLLQAHQRRRDSVVRFALLVRGPLVLLAFGAGVLLARAGHFGLWR
ncbi:MAG: hypothetical protein RXR20_12710 [Paraburkholderia sp.]|uniref:hypothetical protein n=1 Tax=Burkholderiaceae TaxID=119060 RepID=UPI0010F9D7C6|nr:hypothetical protein [Burkholderia sp. 4M9327F10]